MHKFLHCLLGLGFTIRGGSDEEIEGNSEQGIFVTSIKSNGAAARSGRINIGDRILQVLEQIICCHVL